MSIYDEPTFDGTSEAVAMGPVMDPPEGFVEQAVARGLAFVEAEEALIDLAAEEPRRDAAANDDSEPDGAGARLREPVGDEPPDQPPASFGEAPRRHDSGVILLPVLNDAPTSDDSHRE